MPKTAQLSLEEMLKIVDRQEPFQDRMKRMNDLYETNFYRPEVTPAEAPPHDEAGDLIEED